MSSLVTNDSPKHALPRENILPKKLDNDSSLSCPGRHSLHPHKHIVYSKENIFIPERTWKWSRKIYPLDIKDLDNNNRIKGHHISHTDFHKHFTPKAASTVQVGIFEQGRLIQTTMKDFGSCFLPTKGNGTSNLIIRDAPSKNLIRIVFE